jgi:alpha-tubulin suppressor-like RCC1 family protein
MERLVKPRSGRAAVLVAALASAVVLGLAPGSAGAAGGTALSLGYNYSGQAGIGAAYTEAGPKNCYCVFVPTPMLGVDNTTGIVAGYEFGLALRSDGSVLSWGYNYEGELGDGTRDQSSVPKPIEGISNAIAVAAGSAHALALLSDGTVLAWGSNDDGELGLGSATGPEDCLAIPCAKRPHRVPGLSGVVAIAAGSNDSYALLADGTVVGWGRDQKGALGTSPAAANECICVPTPTQIPGVGGAVAIAGGEDTAAAILGDGTVRNWGSNENGELGVGQVTGEGCLCLGAVAPAGLAGVRQLSSGSAHSVAIVAPGTAVSWGLNDHGQVGTGSPSVSPCLCVPTPTTIGALSDVRKVDAGVEFSAALLGDGTVKVWGENDYGQLGDGKVGTDSASPVAMAGVSGASDVAATDYNTYVIVGPSQKLSLEFAGTGAGSVGSSGIVCAKACVQPFAQGQVKALRAEPASPGQFAGFTGAGCSGTGPCYARLDSDQTVTATFGKPKGTRITRLKLSGKKRKKAKVRFTAPGAVTGFQCLLVKPKAKKRGAKKSAKKKKKKPRFAKCASGKTYKRLKPGRYTFKVRALNILGADPKPAKRSFRVRARSPGPRRAG